MNNINKEENLPHSEKQMPSMIISYTSWVKFQFYWLSNCIGPIWGLLHYVHRLAMTYFCFSFHHNLTNDYISWKKKKRIWPSKRKTRQHLKSMLYSRSWFRMWSPVIPLQTWVHAMLSVPGLWSVKMKGLTSPFLVNLYSILLLNLAFSLRKIRKFKDILL